MTRILHHKPKSGQALLASAKKKRRLRHQHKAYAAEMKYWDNMAGLPAIPRRGFKPFHTMDLKIEKFSLWLAGKIGRG